MSFLYNKDAVERAKSNERYSDIFVNKSSVEFVALSPLQKTKRRSRPGPFGSDGQSSHTVHIASTCMRIHETK